MIYLLTYGANAAAFAAILRWGRGWEKITVAVLVASIVADPFLAGIWVGDWRAGVAIPNALLLAALWALAHRADRWWLVIAASIQLVIVATHVLPMLTSIHLIWSGFALRRGLYALMSVLLFFGAWEAWTARYSRGQYGDKKL